VADVDLGAIRKRILDLAATASRDREPQKRFSVKGLFRVHLHARFDPTDSATIDSEPAVTEAEIFQAAYGDPLGRDYWRAWLSEPFHPLQVAELIATHAAPSEPLFQCVQAQILSVLLTANFANTSSAIGWLIFTPHIAHLVPTSLREYLSGAEAPMAAETGAAVEHAPPRRPRRGRPSVVGPRVEREMRDAIENGEMTRDQLGAMFEKNLEQRFKACRDICRNARNTVLSD
jgi:hypothetical protein